MRGFLYLDYDFGGTGNFGAARVPSSQSTDRPVTTPSEFLSANHPFDVLPSPVLDELATELTTEAFRAGDKLIEMGARNEHLFIVQSGAVEVLDPEGRLLAQMGEGDIFGQRSLMAGGVASNVVRGIEEGTVFKLTAERFRALSRDYPRFRHFFDPIGAQRLRGAVQILEHEGTQSVGLLTTPLREFVSREPVCVPPGTTIREAAQVMDEAGVSSLLIVEDDELRGIITDRDLRSRVLAAGLSHDRVVDEIMSQHPVALDSGSYAHEALLSMSRSGIKHLPVVDGRRVIGMVTATDLMRRQSSSAAYIVREIDRCTDVASLVAVSRQLPSLLVNLDSANATAHSIGQLVTSMGEAITIRLLQLAEGDLGPAPVPYAWLAAGSQARREQTAHSDQDNCLLLPDEYDESAHGAYFEQLTRFVCDGLDASGYIYCPGEIMAMTPRWRQPLSVWKRYFSTWINEPDPRALVNATVFFDMRCLHGDSELFQTLRTHYLEMAKSNRIFIAFLAANALQFQPPLGFFRNFVLVKDGEHGRTLDLKHRGVVPIIDLARVYALSHGISRVNTRDRLEEAAETGALSKTGAADLRDALEFISAVRLHHQARQIRNGDKPDNYLAPKDLSHFERNHLKDAFTVVATMQSAMGQRYQAGRLG